MRARRRALRRARAASRTMPASSAMATVVTTPELWARTLDVNLTGGFYVAKAAMPELRRNEGRHRPHRLGAGHGGAEGRARLCRRQARADRARHRHGDGRGGRTACASSAWRPARSTRRCCARPSISIRTRRRSTRRSTPCIRSAAAPSRDEIAEVIAFLLSDKASFMTGETVRVDGGMLARIPGAPPKTGRDQSDEDRRHQGHHRRHAARGAAAPCGRRPLGPLRAHHRRGGDRRGAFPAGASWAAAANRPRTRSRACCPISRAMIRCSSSSCAGRS